MRTHPVGGDRRSGVVRDWHDARGFGFIAPDDGGRRVFAHVSAFPSGRRPTQGRTVTFTVAADRDGRPQAVDVRYPGRAGARRPRGLAPVLGGTGLFLVGVGALAALEVLPLWVPAVYLVMSVLTYLAYAGDKAAAGAGRWRTPEQTLHTLALLGGWPGALVARRMLRHKTIKQPFRTVFWLTVVVNLVALATVGWLAGQPSA